MHINVKTNDPRNYLILTSDIPLGVRITSPPPLETKMFSLSSTLDISINIDLNLTKVVTSVVSAWIVGKLLQGRGKVEIYFNGQKIAIDQPNALKLIEDTINQNKS